MLLQAGQHDGFKAGLYNDYFLNGIYTEFFTGSFLQTGLVRTNENKTIDLFEKYPKKTCEN
jgi:hypothetical protein